jgi:transposase
MAATSRVLPDLTQLDAASLRALVLSQHEQLISRDAEIEHLKLLIAKLRRMQFGRRSEKVAWQIEQLQLRLDELEAGRAEQAASVAERVGDPEAPRSTRPARRPLPAHLPRQTRKIPPQHTTCPDCGGELKPLGEDVSEMLEYIPASFVVIRQVREKLACGRCDKIVQAPAPSRPIARGMAGPGLLAHVLVSKYGDHLPLYRQEEIYERHGVELERATLADWVGQTSALLDPLVEALRRHVMAAQKLHADDTPVPVLAPGLGKTKLGRLWTYVRDDRPAGDTTPPAVWFAYSPDRKGEHPRVHLSSFTGVLQADAYAGFDQLYEGGRIQEAACWAHVRRKFYDLHVAHKSPVAQEALRRIGELYAVEEDIRGRQPEERRQVRNERSRPLLASLKQWLEETLVKLSRKSDTAQAVRYALGRWEALLRYVDDGRLEIDNNAAERALRVVALGRKNYLFAGSDPGASYCSSDHLL